VSLSQGSTFVNKQYCSLSPHLWVIISDPSQDKDRIVIINVSTWRNKALILNDESCILSTGEHSFIQEKSYVFYKEARITSESALQEGIEGGVLIPCDDCSAKLLEKILAGTMLSKFTPNGVIEVLQEQGLID
jgi:hypothetical protein